MKNSNIDRAYIYSQLTLQPIRTPNHEWLACIVASWCAGQSVLPDYLGLECHVSIRTHSYLTMGEIPSIDSSGRIDLPVNEEIVLDDSTAHIVPSNLTNLSKGEGVKLAKNMSDFLSLKAYYFADYPLPDIAPSGKQLDFERMLERQDLINLLKNYSRPEVVEIDWVIGLLVAGCLGNDHLWHDLGLWSRSQLTALLNYNFPELAARNTHDMKWKKFLYKQLCEEEGLYLCRAPSCQVCVDYGVCYGSEEAIIETQAPHADETAVLI